MWHIYIYIQICYHIYSAQLSLKKATYCKWYRWAHHCRGWHLFQVKQRIDFKILLLTYKALNGLVPAYLREQLVPYSPTRTLRSKENHQLTSPRCRLENFGRRSFAAAAPMLWNNLPLNIKRSPSLDIFKSRTKTHLFQLAYFAWLFKCICECLVMLLFHVMYFGIGRFSFCSYATRIFTSALVSKGQISVCNICPILKPALYKYHTLLLLSGTVFENRESPWCQLFHYRQHRRLSWRQPPVSLVTTKLASWHL